MKINKKIIKELSDYLEEFNLTELEYTEKDTKIKVSKNKLAIDKLLDNENSYKSNPFLSLKRNSPCFWNKFTISMAQFVFRIKSKRISQI